MESRISVIQKSTG